MKQLKGKVVPVKTFVDDNNYHIWGFHFFNRDSRSKEFDADFEMLQNPTPNLKAIEAYAKAVSEMQDSGKDGQ